MSSAELVGILNITPDSFSDGGKFTSADRALEHASRLFEDGASIIDIGAESTRPGATPLNHIEEWERLEPVLQHLIPSHPGSISIDTYHPETVRKAASELGSFIVNDVTGFNNPQMIEATAELGLECIVSHLPSAYGQDIQKAHIDKPVDSEEQVLDELLSRRNQIVLYGVHQSGIKLDPGIGFAKTPTLNRRLLRFAEHVPGIDVMVGYSRKLFLGENRMDLGPNLEAGRIAIAAGTKYLRVHDVAGHRSLL